jgi:hypothetical protein
MVRSFAADKHEGDHIFSGPYQPGCLGRGPFALLVAGRIPPCHAGLIPGRSWSDCEELCDEACYLNELHDELRAGHFCEAQMLKYLCIGGDFEGDEFGGPSHHAEVGLERLAPGARPGAVSWQAEVDLVAAEAGPVATTLGAVCGPRAWQHVEGEAAARRDALEYVTVSGLYSQTSGSLAHKLVVVSPRSSFEMEEPLRSCPRPTRPVWPSLFGSVCSAGPSGRAPGGEGDLPGEDGGLAYCGFS